MNLSSKRIPKTPSDEEVLMCWLSVANSLLVKSLLFLSRIIAWNLPGWMTILLLLDQLTAMLLSGPNNLITLKDFVEKVDQVLSSEKLWIVAFLMITALTRIAPTIEPGGSPKNISNKLWCMLFLLTHFYRSCT